MQGLAGTSQKIRLQQQLQQQQYQMKLQQDASSFVADKSIDRSSLNHDPTHKYQVQNVAGGQGSQNETKQVHPPVNPNGQQA
mmetsp:Transcript_3026/g.5110  ORF Transcript_3026/g.5110 Transcript_3026/m.5110 type:complete len:82 (-) Transcript_3026:1288-1533(-)